jgi:SsrA-binding protein
MKIIAENKKVRFDYFIEETFEAGIALEGSEVKSLRQGNVNLKESFALVCDGQLILKNAHISPYTKQSGFNSTDPKRDRVLLMHKREIEKLSSKVSRQGYTLAVTKLYFKGPLVKAEVALCRGKKLHDKRQAITEREQKIAAEREMKNYRID